MMTLQEICSEADKAKGDMKRLTELWEYVQKRKEYYKEHEREFIREHLNKYAKIIKQDERRAAARKQYEDD